MTACIAVVEDEATVLSLLCEILQWLDFHVSGIHHPDDIETICEGQRPDLFLIDLMLPCIDGIQLAERLRARGYAETPMIALSASGWMIREAEASGYFQAVIPKPFDVSQLLDTVEHLACSTIESVVRM